MSAPLKLVNINSLNKFAFKSKADHPLMRVFSYVRMSRFMILFESGSMARKHANKRQTDSVGRREKNMQYMMYNKTQYIL